MKSGGIIVMRLARRFTDGTRLFVYCNDNGAEIGVAEDKLRNRPDPKEE